MERTFDQGLLRIDRAEYLDALSVIKHAFLVGDLKRPSLHPFTRDHRVELIVCNYDAGDDGRFHWHRVVTEYEWVAEGEIGYFEVATGGMHWFAEGDFVAIPPGACVQRRVRRPAKTLALKIPSSPEKVLCGGCQRECPYRVESYQGLVTQ